MGRDRQRLERIERLLPDPFGKPDGLVPTTDGGRYSLQSGGGGGGVASVTGDGTTASVDNTDPANPIVSAQLALDAAEAYTDAAIAAIPPTKRSPGCIFTNGNLVLSGSLSSEVSIPYAGTISGWTIVGDVTGSASIVVSRSTYANYDTMTTLFTASVSSAKKAQATGLSYAITAGDVVRFSGSGFSGFTRCSIVLTVQ